MELGNMVFGNSRGEAPVPRDESFEGPWQRLCDSLRINWRGYPDDGCTLAQNQAGDIDTATFRIRAYDWDAECDCGFDASAEAWHKANPHRPECYQTELKTAMEGYDAKTGFASIEAAAFGGDSSIFSGFDQEIRQEGPFTVGVFMPRKDASMEAWRVAHDKRDRFEEQTRRKLCRLRGLPFPSGSAVHCDCQKGRDAEAWFAVHDHAENCRLVQPNFLFKPTGFRLHWYKYPFRDSYMTPGISATEWSAIIDRCVASGAN